MEKLQKRLNAMGEEVNPTFHKEFIESRVLPEWPNYYAVAKFRSVRRAIKRGRVDLYSGVIFPPRPFNNRKPTKGRKFNELKKNIYEQLIYRA